MKKNDIKKIKDLGAEALDLKKKIALAYMNIRVGKEKNLKAVKNLRRDLARVLTAKNAKGEE